MLLRIIKRSHFLQLLLERGANLECKDEDGAIPLHDACAGGKAALVLYCFVLFSYFFVRLQEK